MQFLTACLDKTVINNFCYPDIAPKILNTDFILPEAWQKNIQDVISITMEVFLFDTRSWRWWKMVNNGIFQKLQIGS
jgi:hypothetical protein